MDEGHEVVCADIKPKEFWFQLFEENKNLFVAQFVKIKLITKI